MFLLRCVFLTLTAWLTPSETDVVRQLDQLADHRFQVRQRAWKQLDARVKPGQLPLAIERGCFHEDAEIRLHCQRWAAKAMPLVQMLELKEPPVIHNGVDPAAGILPTIYNLSGPCILQYNEENSEGRSIKFYNNQDKNFVGEEGISTAEQLKPYCLDGRMILSYMCHYYYAQALKNRNIYEWFYDDDYEREATIIMVADMERHRIPRKVIIEILDEMSHRADVLPPSMPDPPACILKQFRGEK